MSGPLSWLADELCDPRLRGLDLDDSASVPAVRAVIQSKPSLLRCYESWYRVLAATLPRRGLVVEIGSGATAFIARRHLPHIVTSDIRSIDGVDCVIDACKLPFARGALAGLAMVNCFHHLPKADDFLRSAGRCVSAGGCIAMIEPWCTPWSRFVYRSLHHEPLDPKRKEWSAVGSGPMSGANTALPWIVFDRDRTRFEREYPQWSISQVRLMMPCAYLLSGGISARPPIADAVHRIACRLERMLPHRLCAMFALIELRRTEHE
jgi:SAM-dependent methyltransferase